MFHEIKFFHLFSWMLAALIMAAFILLQATGNPLLIDIAMQLVFYVVVPVTFFGYHFKKQGIHLKQVAFLRGSVRWIAPLFGLMVLLMAFSLSVFWLMLRALHTVTPPAVGFFFQTAPLPEEIWYLVSLSIIIGIIGPIAEEFVFRGLIMTQLVSRFGLWGGVGLSSFLFGIFHIGFFGSFMFAVVASFLYLKTRNLLIPILLHMFNNMMVVVLLFTNPDFPEWLTVTSINDLYTKAWPNFIVLVVTLALLLAIILRLGKDLEEPPNDLFDVFKDNGKPPIDERPHDPPESRPGSVE